MEEFDKEYEEYKKYTWIIGDIHGMYDPLRTLVNHLDNDNLNKFVFVGDYIDHGPSSKEVLDLIMSLGDKAVTLLGNHEHLLLDTLFNEKHIDEWGTRIWMENGADSTMRSFGYNNFEDFKANIDEKYTDFMKNMKCFHQEDYDNGLFGAKITVVHGGIMPDVPFEEQLEINDYADMTKFINDRKIWIENVPTWIRRDFLNGDPDHWNGHIIIHGHTPTPSLDYYMDELSEKSSTDEDEDEDEEEAEKIDLDRYYLRRHPKNDLIASIDIDTGAAFGNKLTAIGLSASGFNFYGGLTVRVAEVNIKEGYRRTPLKFSSFEINDVRDYGHKV